MGQEWDSTLGFPGEGGRISKKRPFARRPTSGTSTEPHRRKRGDGRQPRSQHRVRPGPGRPPPPPGRVRERPPAEEADVAEVDVPAPRGRHAPPPVQRKRRRRGRKSLTFEHANDLLLGGRAERIAVLDSLKQMRYSLAHFKKRAGVAQDEEAPPPKAMRQRKSVKQTVDPEYSRRRIAKFAKQIVDLCDPLPVDERAAALDQAVRQQAADVRSLISTLPAARQEQFIGARSVLRTLKSSVYSVEASLDCRLEVPLSFEKIAKCNAFLSRKTVSDRTMQRIVLMQIPAPIGESRKRGLRSALFAPSPFRLEPDIRHKMRELVIDDTLHVSDDGRALELDLHQIAAECFSVARDEDTLRVPPPPQLLRLQYMFDAYRYMRGRGATRWGLRPMDIKHDLSSLMYWRDVAFYSGQDKYDKLQMYCKHAIDALNAGAQVTLHKSEVDGSITGAHTFITLTIGEDVVQVHGGGDAAAASAEGGREGPASKMGCCAYCVLRKVADTKAPSPWFDELACSKAERRTCWADHCRAHERPPGCPPDFDPKCPSCDFVCSRKAVLASRQARSEMSVSARTQFDRARRRVHAGVDEHHPQLIWIDQKYRVPSALHLMLNGVGTNIAVTLAAGATPACLRAINEELSKPEHNLYWRVRENAKGRDVRPNGPECRKLLFTPGLLQKLLSIRFEKEISSTRQGTLPQLQSRGAPLLQAAKSRATALPASKKKALSGQSVQSYGVKGGAVLKALGDLRAEQAASSSAVAIATEPSTSNVVPPQSAQVETLTYTNDSDDEDENETSFDIPNEAEEDLESAMLVWRTFLALVLELHAEWDDHDLLERERRAVTAERLGKEWAIAVRKHSKYTCTHYYCHLAFAHLRELIVCNGHLFCGDDAILERGHQRYKRLRTITSAGGKARDVVTGLRPKLTVVRQRVHNEGLEMHAVEMPGRATQEEQLGMLARVLTIRRAKRPQALPSAKAIATELRRCKERQAMKVESANLLKAPAMSP